MSPDEQLKAEAARMINILEIDPKALATNEFVSETLTGLLKALTDAETQRDNAQNDAAGMRSLAALETETCRCDYNNGPEQDCPKHGDINWFAAGLAIARSELVEANRKLEAIRQLTKGIDRETDEALQASLAESIDEILEAKQ